MKEQIIDEAISLFSEKGYFNTSLNEIAKKVDIKKASLYYYFESKDDIYIECVNFVESHFNDIIHQNLTQQQFSYQDYYDTLYFILFKTNIKYVKFMVQLMYTPQRLSKIVMDLILKFQNSFDLIVSEYYKNSNFKQDYKTFYHFVLNNSIAWIYKASWASNFGVLHVIEQNYKENMINLWENFMDE